jgi:hypothetical protein
VSEPGIRLMTLIIRSLTIVKDFVSRKWHSIDNAPLCRTRSAFGKHRSSDYETGGSYALWR